jgi:hypothetical protein
MLTDVLYVNFREIISGMHDSRGVISAVTSIAAAIFVCVIREHSCLAALMTCERVLLISENSKKRTQFSKGREPIYLRRTGPATAWRCAAQLATYAPCDSRSANSPLSN